MRAKKSAGSTEWTTPDDAPELTDTMMAEAEVFQGGQFVRHGPGRPKAAMTRQQINVRLDPDVLARLRQGGPGWQSRINAILRKALGLDVRAAGPQRRLSQQSCRRPGRSEPAGTRPSEKRAASGRPRAHTCPTSHASRSRPAHGRGNMIAATARPT